MVAPSLPLPRIGIDFDNTLADYDALFAALGREEGLPASTAHSKRAVREAVRAGPGGETAWRRLQALAYGPRMNEAVLAGGAADFLHACRDRAINVAVISHKSRFAAYSGVRDDLRACAMRWMEAHGFFDAAGFAIDPTRVFFENDRAAKVRRIATTARTHFVDDLEDVFLHPEFPDGVQRLLFDPAAGVQSGPFDVVTTWSEIADACFGPAHAH